ncbi:MAG: hypothetical protein HYS17_01235 [Micavibrio aeruginosavorus]|uniref:Uncharacterized protein n=1 Tax=Micavibrio aeruginosavorus TaxID=349221 RepID=A0A7T5R2W5_9BACT|nr:MAG: hypothetical protein HYS17_01235 [Micavibrio aeruginosavorus]
MNENATLHNDTRTEFGTVLPLPFWIVPANIALSAANTNTAIDIKGEQQGTERLGQHQEFVWNLWFDNFLPWWMAMSVQLTENTMWHTFAIGAFIDAKHQLEIQALLQSRMADTHKRYQPSLGMCVFGTNVRSLAASERRADHTTQALNQRLIDRMMSTDGGLAAGGNQSDQKGRVRFFIEHVCDRFDNNRIHDETNSGFANICGTGPRTDGTVNMDIDFNRTIMTPRTLNVDFINPVDPQNKDSTYVFNMATNLYGAVVPKIPAINSASEISLQNQFLNLRSAAARRGIAQASFNALVGLKARGTDGSGTDTMQYMVLLLEELGLTNAQALDFVGTNPSYYAQMEILAKKMYQNPDFYRELYDKPENTKRKSVAMSAIASMLDREIYDSQLRAEAITSQLLELKALKVQQTIEDTYSRKGSD